MTGLLLFTLVACKHTPPAPPISGDAEFLCSPEAWPEAHREALLAAQARGLQLALRDRYAWEASDRLMETFNRDPAAYAAYMPVGWVIEERGPEGYVHFLGVSESGVVLQVQVRFDASIPAGEMLPPLGQPLPPEDFRAIAFSAIRTAMEDPRFKKHRPNYNSDVLPWSDNPQDGWAVYLIPGAQSLSDVPLGGGYLAHLSPDGGTVIGWEPLSMGVLSVDVAQIQRASGAGMMTTVLTPLPNESYFAFSTIWSVPLIVSTPENGAWLINGAELCWVQQRIG